MSLNSVNDQSQSCENKKSFDFSDETLDYLLNSKLIDISPLITHQIAVFPGDKMFSHKYSLDFNKIKNQDCNLSLSSMETTMHLGAHADAPYHYHPEGMTIERASLHTYIGPCLVLDFSGLLKEVLNSQSQIQPLSPAPLHQKNILNPLELNLNLWNNFINKITNITKDNSTTESQLELSKSTHTKNKLHKNLKFIIENQTPFTQRILFKTNTFTNYNTWSNNFSYLSSDLVEHLKSFYNTQLIGIDTPSMDHPQSKDLATHQSFYKNQISILEGLTLENVETGIYELIAPPLKIKNAEASPVRALLRKI